MRPSDPPQEEDNQQGNSGDAAFDGTVRMVRSEPSFTPYYALIGKDASRLVYLAEVTVAGADAAKLPAGLPVRVEFAP